MILENYEIKQAIYHLLLVVKSLASSLHFVIWMLKPGRLDLSFEIRPLTYLQISFEKSFRLKMHEERSVYKMYTIYKT